MTNNDYINKFEIDVRLCGKSEDTLKTYLPKIIGFLEHANKNVREITREDFIDYIVVINEKYNEPATINLHISAIQSFWSFLNKGHNIQNITTKAPRPQKYKKERKTLSKEDVEEVKSICDLEFQCLITLGFEAVMRIEDTRRIEVKDLDFKSKEIYIRGSKRNNYRRVPMSKNVERLLAMWLEHSNIKKGKLFTRSQVDIGRKLKPKFEECGLKWGRDYFTFHSLKHSSISLMVHSGIDLKSISDISGTSIEILLKTYVHSSPESRKNAINVFNN